MYVANIDYDQQFNDWAPLELYGVLQHHRLVFLSNAMNREMDFGWLCTIQGRSDEL